MNNLHRELAPISDDAWSQIEDEATRTLKRHMAARRVVDVHGPDGFGLSAIGTGHLTDVESAMNGVSAHLRQVKPLVELLTTFDLDRQQIDDVERGAQDADWEPVKEAAKRLAFAEDRAVFEGNAAAQITGIRQATSNPIAGLPDDPQAYPTAIAEAISQLRLVGVNGPYRAVLSADAYTAVSETSDYGYPLLEHIRRLVSDEIVWAPAISGAFVLTTRGGDFALHLGQDVAVGYLSHTERSVRLYLQESLTFLAFTSEGAVALGGAA
ncbi:MAG: bacteriocin family protein [Chloroflexi bacterium]|nr:bacteriocin family protein [Chloroflexota bacterium]